MNISVVVISKNEEKNIADCISSVKFANEIIVVDAESTDNTANIAQAMGAIVFVQPWHGYGVQKNFGLNNATQNWVLFLDADERVSFELQTAIQNMSESAEHDVYWITVEDIFLSRRMKHLKGHNPRLVKKGHAEWNTNAVHEQIVYLNSDETAKYKDAVSGELVEPIIHQSYTSISDYLKKMHKYTTLDADYMQKNNTHRSGRKVTKSFFLPYKLALRQTIKLLFYKKGILDGWQGIVWSCLSAYYEFEMAKKYLRYPSPQPSPRLGRGR